MAISNQVPTLKKFLVRSRALKLYKNFLRAAKEIPNENVRKEVQDWIRIEFKNKKNEENEYVIKLYLQNGERSLRELKSNISLSK